MLYGLVLVFARMLGLHAESDWMCRSSTFMLLENIIFSGIFSDLGWTTSWRCPARFLFCLLLYHYPLFPPKKKSDAEKAELARAELDEFIASHGKVPSQHSDLPGSKSLYQKLKKLSPCLGSCPRMKSPGLVLPDVVLLPEVVLHDGWAPLMVPHLVPQ